MSPAHDLQHLVYLFQAHRSWYGSPPVLRTRPSQCEGTRLDIIDGLRRYKALQASSMLPLMWRDDMSWIPAQHPLKTARLLVQAGHYGRAFETMPIECRKNPSEIGAFLGVPMSEAEQVFAARIPRAQYDFHRYRTQDSKAILSGVHTLLRRYERRIVPKFETDRLRELLDRSVRKPWKTGEGVKHISAKVSDEVFGLLESEPGSRSAKMRWAILESWAKGPLPPKESWHNLPRPNVCCLKTNPSMYTELFREAKRFKVVIGAVIEEHCHRGLG